MAGLIQYNDRFDSFTGESYTYCFVFGADTNPGQEETLHYFAGDGMKDIRSYRDLQEFSASRGSIEGENPLLHIKETYRSEAIIYSPDMLWPRVNLPYFFHDSRAWSQRCDASGVLYWERGVDKGFITFRPYWETNYKVSVTISSSCYGNCHVVDTGRRYDIKCQPGTSSFGATEYFMTDYYYSKPMHYVLDQIDLEFYIQGAINAAHSLTYESTYYTVPYSCSYSSNRFTLYSTYKVPKGLFDPYLDHLGVLDQHQQPAGLWPRLAQEAISATSFNSNSIANGLELFDLAMSIKSGRIFTDIIKKGKIFETSKNAWLAYRYSYSTTLSDIEELGEYIEDCNSTIVRAGDDTATGLAHLKMKLSPPQAKVKEIVDQLTNLGVAPNLYNLWDMVPFSFVADWFIGLGDVLESITQYGRVNAYDIRYVTTSWKWQHDIEREGITARLEYYERNVSPTAPAYTPYQESSGPSGSTILKRVMDSIALFS